MACGSLGFAAWSVSVKCVRKFQSVSSPFSAQLCSTPDKTMLAVTIPPATRPPLDDILGLIWRNLKKNGLKPAAHKTSSTGHIGIRRRRRQREGQKSNRLAKQQPCTCITLFCTFLYRHCTIVLSNIFSLPFCRLCVRTQPKIVWKVKETHYPR